MSYASLFEIIIKFITLKTSFVYRVESYWKILLSFACSCCNAENQLINDLKLVAYWSHFNYDLISHVNWHVFVYH